ncbi:MAG: hypothetical protein K1060chlam1_01086 [Candidatus Anoxychlamydiales bacterium]|nr:hypothetical protein [Candidatus Anoxychlamydiales bacterium]
MLIPTFACIIGISKYKDDSISNLPAAEIDAIKLARSLKNWGIPQSNITLFLNEQATIKNIETYFSKLRQLKEKFNMLFYFCGHGFRTSLPHPLSFLAFFDSYIENKYCINGLSLDQTIKKIIQVNSINSYIFIDACYLRINNIPNPKLESELDEKKNSQKGLLCLLSSGIEKSFEDQAEHYGYFTDALLKSLSQIRLYNASPTTFIDLINQQLLEKNLPLPEVYNIGIQQIDFLLQKLSFEWEKNNLIRKNVLASIQDISVNQHRKIICLIGKMGSGKSTICKQLESEKFKMICLQDLCKINEKNLTDSFILAVENKLKNKFYSSIQSYRYCIFLVDSFVFQDISQLNSFFRFIDEYKLNLLIFSNKSLKEFLNKDLQSFLIEWEIPPFNKEEAYQLLKKNTSNSPKINYELIQLVCKGNPLKLVQSCKSFPLDNLPIEMEKNIENAMAAIYSSGIVLDEELFRKTFSLTKSSLTFLEQNNLLLKSKDYWIAHELLYEVVENKQLTINKKATIDYWHKQIEKLPDHLEGCRSFIVTIKCFGYEDWLDNCLESSFYTLYHHKPIEENISFFKDGIDIFLSKSIISKASLLLIEIFIELDMSNFARKLLFKNAKIKRSLRAKYKILQAIISWKTGNFFESIKYSSEVINYTKNPIELCQAFFNRGISFFLFGKFKAAFSDFSLIHARAKDEKCIGLSRCMLGTIIGLKEKNIPKSKELLESSARLLYKSNDFAGVWLAWNNLSEIMWKIGKYRLSEIYLEKALKISNKINNKTIQLETYRNSLLLYLRTEGAFSKKINSILSDIEKNIFLPEIFVCLQLYNTLGTIYCLRYNLKKAIYYVKKAIPLTVNNSNFHILTLSNISLLYFLLNKKNKANEFYNRAINMAEERKQDLILQQIHFDHKKLASKTTQFT